MVFLQLLFLPELDDVIAIHDNTEEDCDTIGDILEKVIKVSVATESSGDALSFRRRDPPPGLFPNSKSQTCRVARVRTG